MSLLIQWNVVKPLNFSRWEELLHMSREVLLLGLVYKWVIGMRKEKDENM